MLDSKTTKLVKRVVRKYLPDESYQVFIFGSRVSGKNRKFSDLDLGIMGPKSLSPKEYLSIKDGLEESDLPYRIDLIDFTKVSDKFRLVSLNNTIQI